MTNDQAIETEIQAKRKTAPRVTPADIEANIAHEHYFTAFEGVSGPYCYTGPDSETLALLTFCVLVLRNGFIVTGESACASPENFDTEIGRKIARENAINKVWPLMGYALKQQLHDLSRRPHISVDMLTGKHPAQPLKDGDLGKLQNKGGAA